MIKKNSLLESNILNKRLDKNIDEIDLFSSEKFNNGFNPHQSCKKKFSNNFHKENLNSFVQLNVQNPFLEVESK